MKVILKADDFRLNRNPRQFYRLIELCSRHQLPLSIGVIGNGLINKTAVRNASEFTRVLNRFQPYFFSHSYTHRDFLKLHKDDILSELDQTSEAFFQLSAQRLSAFGFPFNRFDDATISIVAAHGYNYIFERSFNSQAFISPEVVTPLFSRSVSYDHMVNRLLAKQCLSDTGELIADRQIFLQIHPSCWLTESFVEFERILLFLLERGASFTLPEVARDASDDGCRAAPVSPIATFDPASDLISESLQAVVAESIRIVRSAVTEESQKGSEQAAAFQNRSGHYKYLMGSFERELSVIPAFIMQDYLLYHGVYSAKRILDFGSGYGQWAAAHYLLGGLGEIDIVEKDAIALQVLKALFERLAPGKHRLTPNLASTQDQNAIDLVIAGNVLNYVSIDLLKPTLRQLKPGGFFIVTLQNIYFVVQDLFSQATFTPQGKRLIFDLIDRVTTGHRKADSVHCWFPARFFVTLMRSYGLDLLSAGTASIEKNKNYPYDILVFVKDLEQCSEASPEYLLARRACGANLIPPETQGDQIDYRQFVNPKSVNRLNHMKDREEAGKFPLRKFDEFWDADQFGSEFLEFALKSESNPHT